MSKLNLNPIERVSTISKEEFKSQYYKNQKPVIIENLTQQWPAYNKWNLTYIKDIAGSKLVPLYDDRPVSHKDTFNQAHAEMTMSQYIDLLQTTPTNYRIFLYNLLKEVPELQHDFHWPDLGLRLIKQIPMMFFGGQDSKVFMHFDIDYANILHFNFHGTKQCMLFAPDQTKYLYKVPHSLIAREDINFDNPDFSKFPALAKATGFVAELRHGETLYMPEGYWHYMKYLTPSISMSLRSFPSNPRNLVMAAYNLTCMRYYDQIMRKYKGQQWIDYKNQKAIQDTNKNI